MVWGWWQVLSESEWYVKVWKDVRLGKSDRWNDVSLYTPIELLLQDILIQSLIIDFLKLTGTNVKELLSISLNSLWWSVAVSACPSHNLIYAFGRYFSAHHSSKKELKTLLNLFWICTSLLLFVFLLILKDLCCMACISLFAL